jgi:small conductance mechanosensitive channel
MIKNYSAQPYRRVDAVAKIANGVDPTVAMVKLREAVCNIPIVMKSPAPDVEILELTAEGPKLCVRPYCHTDHYWQVYFATLNAVVETFGKAGYPAPETPIAHRVVSNP